MHLKPTHQRNFEQLCEHVLHHYQPILSIFEVDFFKHYRSINKSAQRLFIQLLQQPNHTTHLSSNNFQNIDNLEQAIKELMTLPFVQLDMNHHSNAQHDTKAIRLSCKDTWQLYQLLYFENSISHFGNIAEQKNLSPLKPTRIYKDREELEWYLTILSFQTLLSTQTLNHSELLEIQTYLPQLPDTANCSAWLINELTYLKNSLTRLLG